MKTRVASPAVNRSMRAAYCVPRLPAAYLKSKRGKDFAGR